MSVDKRITYRRNFKGGADASMADFGSPSTPGVSAGRTGPGPNVSAGGASFNDLGPGPSGDDFRRSRTEFIDKFNQDRARDFKPTAFRRTYKPIGLDKFGSSNQLGAKGGIRNLFKALLGFAVPGASFLFNKGKQGITSINDKLGDFREKFTGYRTQEEYDNARQQRINLNRINTIQNTLDRKYSDGDYSNTNLDERLAALKSQMGITPNTAADLRPDLDFSNQPELLFEGIQTLAQPNLNSFPGMGVAPNNYNRQFIEPLAPNLEDPVKDQVGVLDDVYADALTIPTMGQYGLNLMQLNKLKNAGYSNNQIEEAAERGYAEELVRNIEGPIGVV